MNNFNTKRWLRYTKRHLYQHRVEVGPAHANRFRYNTSIYTASILFYD